MDCAQYQELAAADVDGRLEGAERAAAAAHVASCPRCAALRRRQAATKALLRQRAAPAPVPAALRERILADLDREAAPPAPRPRWSVRRRLLLVGAVAAALALVVVPGRRPPAPDLLAVLVRDVHAADAQEAPLAVRTADVEELRRYYRSTGRIDFEQTVEDFGAMGFRPLGGAVAPIGEVAATFTVYEGAIGKLVCRRFRAGAIPLPEGGERRGAAQLFTVDGTSVLIQQAGDAICCLASAAPRDAFVRALLAQAHDH